MHARVEWIGAPIPECDQHGITEFGPSAESRLEMIRWHGYEVLVPPLDIQLQVSKRRGMGERAALIRQAMDEIKATGMPGTAT